MVLAAGRGQRLGSLTAALPKTLLRVDHERTILDIILGNLKRVAIDDILIIVGFASARIVERVPDLERHHDVRLHLVTNPRAESWNNAYSLWCGREAFSEGVLLVNGDTVHPPAVEERLLAVCRDELMLAVDQEKPLSIEDMKVRCSPDNRLTCIGKDIAVARADGEYIGVAVIDSVAADSLTDALEDTWRRDPSLYYEDAFQRFVDSGNTARIVPIGNVEWTEVDDKRDLERARRLACRC